MSDQGMRRREFLKVGGAAAAGVAVGVGGPRAVAALMRPPGELVRVPGGPESWANTVCGECPGGCGLRVRRIAERAVRVEGNDLCPVSRGALCPRGASTLQGHYAPGRLLSPRARTSRSAPWKELSWEEALGLLADRLRALRDKHPERLALAVGAGRPHASLLLRRFARAFGTPNVLDASPLEPGPRGALLMTQGVEGTPAYDLARAKTILSFGAPLLEAWDAPVWAQRAYGLFRRGHSGRRGRLVQVDARMSPTAARADEWIAVHPGTEGALALGIAHVLVREGLFDRSFVEERTFGFEDWRDEAGRPRMGFKSLLVAQYPPDRVADLTGVPVVTILRVAREVASGSPAVAVAGAGSGWMSQGTYDAFAVQALNALLGSIEAPGGMLVPLAPPLGSLEEEAIDPRAKRGLAAPPLVPPAPLGGASLDLLPRALEAQGTSLEGLLLWEADPVGRSPEGERWRGLLSKIPFVVSTASVVDATTESSADLVIPDAAPLERWQTALPTAGGNAIVLVGKPVLPGKGPDTAGVVLETARRLGGGPAESLPWKDVEGFLKVWIEGLWRARRGTPNVGEFEADWIAQLEHGGWWVPSAKDLGEFTQQVVERGGWSDPLYRYGEWGRTLRTRSGRFEFFSRLLEERLRSSARAAGGEGEGALEAILVRLGIRARGDEVYLPHFEGPEPAAKEGWPLSLVPYVLLTTGEGEGVGRPWIEESLAPHLPVKWEAWAELHPETAQRLGLDEGSWAELETPAGKARLRVRLFPGIPADVVALPLGRPGLGARIVGFRRDPLGGFALRPGTAARMRRA